MRDLQLWGYDSAAGVWRKVAVDASGLLTVDMSNVNLDDLADVSVPTPTDGYFLYWDAATSLWKCKEVTAAGTFLTLTDTPSTYAAQAGKYTKVNAAENALEFGLTLEDHSARHEDGGLDEISLAALSGDPADTINKSLLTTQGDIIVRGAAIPERLAIGTNRFFPRVNEAGNALEYVKGYEWGQYIRPWQYELAFYDWTTTLTGSGAVVAKLYGCIQLKSGTTANSTARGRGYGFGWIGWGTDNFEWYTIFSPRTALTSTGKIWMKIGADAAADPTNRAIGWRVDGTALKGIVHNGTTLTVVDLGVTVVLWSGYTLFLKYIAGSKIEWYVDGVKKGESTNIPTTTGEYDHYCSFAVANGANAANHEAAIWRHGWIWQ